MGQYHMPVNLDKKEYVNPQKLGIGLKALEQLFGTFSSGDVIGVLLMTSNGRGGGDLDEEGDPNKMIGRWVGDRVVVLGDYVEDGDIPDSDIKWEEVESTFLDITDLVIPILNYHAKWEDETFSIDTKCEGWRCREKKHKCWCSLHDSSLCQEGMCRNKKKI